MAIDLDSVRSQISSKSKVILVPHFFGYPQNMSKIRSVCDEFDLLIIEDCAHAFLTFGPNSIGNSGDYVIGSTRKFLSGADGGCLVSGDRRIDRTLIRRNSATEEIRAVIDWIEDSLDYNNARLWAKLLLPLLRAKTALRRSASSMAEDGNTISAPAAEDDYANIDVRYMSKVSQHILRNQSFREIVGRRQENFDYLIDRFRGIQGLESLFSERPPGFIPYMLPLIVRKPEIYSRLMSERWPVWRWDYSDESCEISRFYAKHLIQVPCHQSLDKEDMKCIAEAIVRLNAEQ